MWDKLNIIQNNFFRYNIVQQNLEKTNCSRNKTKMKTKQGDWVDKMLNGQEVDQTNRKGLS